MPKICVVSDAIDVDFRLRILTEILVPINTYKYFHFFYNIVGKVNMTRELIRLKWGRYTLMFSQ